MGVGRIWGDNFEEVAGQTDQRLTELALADRLIGLIEAEIVGEHPAPRFEKDVIDGLGALFPTLWWLRGHDQKIVFDRLVAMCKHVDGEEERNLRRDYVRTNVLDPLEAEWFPPPVTP